MGTESEQATVIQRLKISFDFPHLRISRADFNLKSLRSCSGCTSYWSWKEKLLRRAWPIAKPRMDPFRFLGQHTIA